MCEPSRVFDGDFRKDLTVQFDSGLLEPEDELVVIESVQPCGGAYTDVAETGTRVAAAAAQTGLGLTLLPVLYMQGGCDGRAPEGGQTRFACVDGPEFDAHQVDWDELMSRQRTYIDEEKYSLSEWQRKQCNTA